MQSGCTGCQQFGAQVGGGIDTDPTHFVGIVDTVEAIGQPRGERCTRQFGHALHLATIRHRHDAGNDRLGDTEYGKFVDHADVVLGLEEELRDREIGAAQLFRKEAAVIGTRSTTWVTLGVCGDTDAEATSVAKVFDEVECVLVVTRSHVGGVGGRVAAEGKNVLDVGCLVGVENRIDVGAGMADASEVRHRGNVGFLAHPDDEVTCALAGAASRTVGNRNERRVQTLEFGDGATKRQLGRISLRGKELEGEGAPHSEEVGDAGHLPRV